MYWDEWFRLCELQQMIDWDFEMWNIDVEEYKAISFHIECLKDRLLEIM